MKRAIAIFLSLAIIIALCPAMISTASEGGSKIDLSGYLNGMTDISKFAQPVATASASYENWGLGIAALLDGNTSTRFIGVNEADVNAAAPFSPMWIQLDLQEVYTIGAVEFNSWQNGTKAGLPTAFTIQVSTDGVAWTTVHTETDLPLTTVANSSLYSISFDAVDARYVKLDVTAIGAACDVGNYVCLSELAVFTGVKAEEVVPSTSPEIDLTGYVAGMTSASGFAQNVISTNHSEEEWGLGVASLIDGKTVGDPRYIGTGASSFDPTWILVDLQKVYTVDKFAFYTWQWNNNPGMPKDFTIETSMDGETWTVAHTQTDLAITEVVNSNLYEFSFKAVDARYVKLNVTAIGANADTGPHLCLCEVKVFGVEKSEGGDDEVIVPVGEKINLSGATASESLEIWGFGAANLIDGSLDTMYCSESTGAGVAAFKETWITLDLGKNYMVDQFKYFSYAAGDQGRPNNIVIEVSVDGETWTEAYKNENVPLTTVADSVEYAFAFKAVEAQYIRLTVKSVAANWDLGPCVNLREIEVYGVGKTEGGDEGGDDEVIVPVGEKIDLTTIPQGAVTSNESYEYWGIGIATLTDGSWDTRYIGKTMPDGFAAIDPAAPFAHTWIQVDLQKVYSVDQFEFESYAADLRGLPTAFTIQVSVDGVEWKTVHTETNMPVTSVADSTHYAFAFAAADARYVKLDVTAIGAACDLGNNLCLREISVYGIEKTEGGDEGGDDEVIVPVGEKIDLSGATASESLEIWGFGAANLIDGSLDTMYCSESTGAGVAAFKETWITLDLGKNYMVDQFKYFSYAAGDQGRPNNIVIEVSVDGETWTEAYKNENVPLTTVADSVEYAFAFKAVEAQYIRLTVKSVAANWDLGPCVNLREIEVYGAEKAAEGGDDEVIVPVGDKIDLSGYVAGMTSPSGYAQTVVTTSASLELWGFGQASLIDGNIFSINANQYYCSESTGSGTTSFTEAWIQLDLQKVYTVDQFKFYSFMAADRGRPNNIVIETSLDGKTWTVAYKNENVPLTTVADSVEYAFAFKAVDARYVKLTVKGVADNWDLGPCVCLREVEVYGKTTEEVVRGDKLDINADKVTVSGEFTPNMGKNNLFDGKLDSIFAAIDPAKAPGTRMDEWFQIDLQQSYTVNRIRLANRSDAVPLSGLPSTFDVMVSDDGKTWKVVKSVNGISESDITEKHWLTVDFEPVEARYVRVRAYDIAAIAEASLGYAVTLREFEVHTAEGKIDLSSYVNLEDWSGHPGENSQWKSYASNYPQNVVTASQSYELWGWGIAGLIDGMIGTESIFCCRVNSDAAGPVQSLKNEITVDLGAAYFLDTMRFASMAANSLAGLPIDFKLEVSLTGAQWRTVLNKTQLSTADAEADGQFYSFAFEPTEAIRFVRLTATKVSEVASEELGFCTVLSELELYGILDPTTVIKPDGYGQIDLTKSVLRATNSYNLWGHGTGNLYNGGQNGNMFIATSVDDAEYYAMFKDTQVFENTSNEFIKIRLDGIYEIDLMRFQSQFPGSGRGVPQSYTLEVSMDGETWTTALFVDGKTVSNDDWYSDEIVPVQTRYLRLKFHSFIEVGDLGYAAHLKELEFFGVLIEKDQIDLDVPAPEPPALEPLPGDNPETGDTTAILMVTAMTVTVLMLAVLVLNRRKFA